MNYHFIKIKNPVKLIDRVLDVQLFAKFINLLAKIDRVFSLIQKALHPEKFEIDRDQPCHL